MHYPSRLIEEAVDEISHLPGIGKKSALRIALFLLKQDASMAEDLAAALNALVHNITYCRQCHNLSDTVGLCNICSAANRDHHIICVVEDIPAVMAIEDTSQYKGLYHLLGGVISPIGGVAPSDLNIESLIFRLNQPTEVDKQPVSEVILALSPTMEGDTTAFYIQSKLKHLPIKISTLARGVPIGNDLEYADQVTLGRSIVTRTIS